MLVVRDYEYDPDQRAVDSFNRAYDYYSALFEEDPTPPFAAWHIPGLFAHGSAHQAGGLCRLRFQDDRLAGGESV